MMPRNPRRYDLEYEAYDGKPEVKKKRAERNRARREAVKNGEASKGDGKDVHHVTPLAKGGMKGSKTKVIPASENRSFARTKTARMK
jgi:hypothetical protein